jgi:predicted glycoside hydrolase/deacetylase ChbG (UPF0249 family)
MDWASNSMPSGRSLIVNADDFGLSTGVNLGIVQAYDSGIVTSASLMVHMPAAAAAAALARERPLLSLGLHLDVGEWRWERGGWSPVYERAPPNDFQGLEAAVFEQLDLFRRLVGSEPTHLDSHQHAHKRNPLQSIVCRLATHLGVPVRHFCTRVSYCGAFYGQNEEGRPVHGRLRDRFLVDTIEGLQEEVTELCCHPAAQLDFQSPYATERLMELKLLCSPVVREAVDRSGVALASFADLKH